MVQIIHKLAKSALCVRFSACVQMYLLTVMQMCLKATVQTA